jgi:hypothetical protein
LAFRLAVSRKIRFLDIPTYRLRLGSPGSVSASTQYLLGQPDALQTLLELDLPTNIRRALRRKLSSSLHAISERSQKDGNNLAAWRYHLRSLFISGGYRYLLYTRHLLWRSNTQ